MLLGSYRYTEKSTVDEQAHDAELRLLVTPDGRDSSQETGAAGEAAAVIAQATTVATAVALARDLTNTPSLRKSPQWLADAAVQRRRRLGPGESGSGPIRSCSARVSEASPLSDRALTARRG